ncbi:MAG: thiamine phosphate synthase, partial [Anaerolineae bacterium]|nr:thiamine phosphate synthase [Anaerolineae bacterium]
MAFHQSLPDLWLLSDERNAAVLEARLRSFAAPVGFVYRHYHLPDTERYAEFRRLRRIAMAEGHLVVLA